jgi:hypothetical protein
LKWDGTAGGGLPGQEISRPKVALPKPQETRTVKITVDKISLHQGSLWLGVKIYGPQDSWLKFSVLELPIKDIDLQTFSAMVSARHEIEWPGATDNLEPMF